jgi:DNA-directed RNA polymerase subunit beta
MLIAQANIEMENSGKIIAESNCTSRRNFSNDPAKVNYTDVALIKLLISASLIPFLEHDDAIER